MIAIILIVILLIVYFLAENIFMLRVRREKLGGEFRIAHVADLHKRKFGRNNARLCRKIAAEKPDIILMSGDLVSRKCTDFTCAEATLRQLNDIAPVYMVYGNHESDLYREYKKVFEDTVRRTGTILLRNDVETVEKSGRKLHICGLELEREVYKKDGGYRELDVLEIEEMHDKLGKKPEGETLMLVHNPLFAGVYEEWGADWAVCGHVHGGAIMIPFTGVGVLSPERRLFPKYSKGIYTFGKTKLLLSGGLGKLRLFNPPEVVIYEI